MCDLPKNFLEAATKENIRTYQKNPNMKENLC